jgi:hypothetical protein
MRLHALTLLVSVSSFLVCCNNRQIETEENKANNFVLNNTDWKDSDNQPIFAHDGGISRFDKTYYWYGSNYSGNPGGAYGSSAYSNQLNNGINVYSSKDLVIWEYEGVALEEPAKLNSLAGKGSVHRAHVLFNKKTGKYVMWFFYFKDAFPDIMASVAVSDSPTGPFAYIETIKTGSPAITDSKVDNQEQRTEVPAGCAQDLNVFADEDGTAYLVYDDGLRNIRIDKLSEDYLSSTKQTVIALPAGVEKHEAPAMVKFKDKYIIAGSGVCGWGPSPTHYAVAKNPMGPYSIKKMLTPAGKLNSWNSQITSFVYIPESDKLVAMCDQWWIPDCNDLNKSRYLWLEVIYREKENEFEMIYSDTLIINNSKE